jgi:hypothetical protein
MKKTIIIFTIPALALCSGVLVIPSQSKFGILCVTSALSASLRFVFCAES